jgi:hypothetical protein
MGAQPDKERSDKGGTRTHGALYGSGEFGKAQTSLTGK